MIERGTGGRTSALTDWRLMDVASMWACLQDHDTTNHWKQVAGWRKICDLARMHLSRLQEYRKGLAEAWPPETNEAARAYVRELDELIDKVQRTHDAASANYTALSAATQAISATRTELKKIYETYAVKVQEKQTYDATLADPKAAMGSRVPDRPVTDADLERLNVQARGIMHGLSGELQQARVMLQSPTVADTTARNRPRIRGSIRRRAAGQPSHQSSRCRCRWRRRPAHHRSAHRPDLFDLSRPPPRRTPVPFWAELALGWFRHQPALAFQPLRRPHRPIHLLGAERRLRCRQNQSAQCNSAQHGPLGRPNLRGASSPAHPMQPPLNRAMPPGGLIGGVPGMGLGQPSAGHNQPRRVNPIGGLIGGGGAGTAPTGGAVPDPAEAEVLGSLRACPPSEVLRSGVRREWAVRTVQPDVAGGTRPRKRIVGIQTTHGRQIRESPRS